MPNEVLANILSMVDDYSVASSSSRHHIAQVNHKWRQLTLSTPSFWARMNLAFTYRVDNSSSHAEAVPLLDTMKSFRLQLNRTQAKPLDITIILLGPRTPRYERYARDKAIDSKLAEIISSAPRWKSLRLISIRESRLPTPLMTLLEHNYPSSLTHLSVRCCSTGWLPRIVLGGEIPTSLELDTNVCVQAQAYWPILRVAHLSAWPSLAPPSTLGALASATALSELYLAGLNKADDNHPNTPLPSVRRLIWGRHNERCWVNNIILPSLHTLALRGDLLWPDLPLTIPRFRTQYQNAGPTLGAMIFEGRVGTPPNVILDTWTLREEAFAIAAGLHHVIEHLTFTNEGCRDWRVISVANQSANTVFPKLVTVALPSAVNNRGAIESFTTMWRGREKTPRPKNTGSGVNVASHMWPSEASQAAISLVEHSIQEIYRWDPQFITIDDSYSPSPPTSP